MTHVMEDRSNRTPTVLLPYQVRWQEDQAEVKVIEKSRRVGLSWGEASEDALLAASKNGMDVFYVGYNKDMAQEFISDCADWAKTYQKAATEIEEYVFRDEDKDIVTFRYRYAFEHKLIPPTLLPT